MIRLITFLILFFTVSSFAQNSPAFRQFYFNPYLFNSAYAGSNGYTEIYIYHRQQWLNFNNAPIASGFNLQYATPNRVALGFNFTTQEVVALRNSSALLTFAYRLPLSANQYFSFAISGGVGTNDLNLQAGDYSNDPAVLNALNNSFYADGNFGALYTLGRLRIGFALPKLFGQKNFSQQNLGSIQYSQLLNQLYTISYKVPLGNFSIEPYLLYRVNRDNQNFWEASSLLYYKDRLWIGASYNEFQGTGFFVGFDVKEKIRLGYSYELPPVNPEFIAANSHEFHLNIRLGKKKIFKWAQKEPPSPQQSPVTVETELEPEKVAPPAIERDAIVEPRKPAERVIETIPVEEQPPSEEPVVMVEEEKKDEPVVQAPPRQAVFAPGYYIIVASFANAQNALREKDRFIDLGYLDAYASQNQLNKLFYVYIYSSLDFEQARQARDSYRLLSASRNAWILRID